MTPNNSATSRAGFLIPKTSQMIRHRKSVLQGEGIFQTKEQIQTACSFQIQTKIPTERKFLIKTRFFTCWTMTSEKCTRAHVQENKSIYLSIYLSYENLFENGCIYIYIYTRFQKGFHMERYIDRYILLFCCTCARVHFSLVIVRHVKNLVLMRNFLSAGFFVWICEKRKECTNPVGNSFHLHTPGNKRMGNLVSYRLSTVVVTR